jgi:hypothetical protein
VSALLSVAMVLAGLGPAGVSAVPGAPRPLRDVGPEAGLPTALASYSVRARDIDGDGLRDLLFVHHGGPTQLYTNTGDGFALRTTFVDTLHGEVDRHDCAWGDVDLDGRLDLYCVKGAQQGTAEKHNELWMQQPDGTFQDLAGQYRVVDRWGRGRRTTFLHLNDDPYLDLFVGNHYPRRDDHRTPNRTFVNVGGDRFRQVRLGLTRHAGALCVDVADVDRDGRDDLLVCENRALRLYLRRAGGFLDVTDDYGIPRRVATWAQLIDVDRDGHLDLVAITRRFLTVRLWSSRGLFAGPLRFPVEQGRGFAIGNIDGRRGLDIMVVQGCDDEGVNVDDVLLVSDGARTRWRRQPGPGDVAGCGDKAATLDFDLDGADDFVVTNGAGQFGGVGIQGPDQLLTMGSWGT